MDVEKILKLGELGFTAEQISQILELNMDKPSEPQVSTPVEPILPAATEVIKQVETPEIDYAKLADEIALRQQKQNTFNPESPKVEAPPAQKSAEEITLGLF